MSCLVAGSTAYREFATRIRAKAASARIPVMGTIELTANCNLRCRHCYLLPRDPCPDLLSAEDWIRILDALAGVGCLWLGITGGEPLSRPDFPRIYREAHQRGFLITLLTNGTLLDDATADLLADHPPMAVEVSLYGASPETCREVTGSAFAFDACLAGVRRLMARNVQVVLKTTLTRDNVDDLPAMEALARELGLSFRFDGVLNGHVDGGGDPLALRIPPGRLVALEMERPAVGSTWSERAAQLAAAEPRKESAFGCAAGVNAFHVTASGLLCPCVIVREPSADLCHVDFLTAWNDPIREAVAARYSPSDRCHHCTLGYLCNICPGFGLLESGLATVAVEYLCEIAEARARLFAYSDCHVTGTIKPESRRD